MMQFTLIGILLLWKLLDVVNGISHFEPVGCFLDSGTSPHPLPILLQDYRPEMNWNNMESVIDLCADLAHSRHYSYFGLQYYGQCWSGATAGQTYHLDGPADNCIRGVGLGSSYFVYKFYEYGDKVPGCKDTWKAQKDSCFHTITNSSLTDSEAKNYCQENGGDLVQVLDTDGLRLVEQFLYSMQLNGPLNQSQCFVVGRANASLDGNFVQLPTVISDGDLVSTCAKRKSNQKWHLQNCQSQSCNHLCISSREITPGTGTFIQVATDVVLTGHVIVRLIVDDVIQCARECLQYLNCISFNYEYKPDDDREYTTLGNVCELNDDARGDLKEGLLQKKSGYKYYEQLRT